MHKLVCPHCWSANLRRSHSRGLGEKVKRQLGWKAYRCQKCEWRGMIREGMSASGKRKVLMAFLLVLTLYLFIRLVFYLAKRPFPL